MINYIKEDIEKIVEESYSLAEVCRKLNYKISGSGYARIKKYIKDYNLDITHFTGQSWNQGENYKHFGKNIPLDEILIENSTYNNNYGLKNKLLKNKLKEYKCEECGIINWNNKLISLQLHHVNGNNTDNRIENLKILCPNCHSQTDNFGSKNINNKNIYSCEELIYAISNSNKYLGVKKILNLSRSGSNKTIKNFMNKYNLKFGHKITDEEILKIKNNETKTENFCKCGKKINKNSENCLDCYHVLERKINRPELDILINELKESNYTKLGKKYNVSDNTIRKWINKKYE